MKPIIEKNDQNTILTKEITEGRSTGNVYCKKDAFNIIQIA